MFNKILKKMEEILHIRRKGEGNRLNNKSAFVFKNMSRDCLRQCCRTNRIAKKVNELEGERISQKEWRKEKKRKEWELKR